MSVITRTLVGFVGRFLFAVFSLKTRISERLTFIFHKRHLIQNVVARASDLNSAQKIAIFALYPQDATWNSVERANNYLKRAGFTTIFVVNHNELAKNWVANLETQDVTVIVRPNIGHDFGAYQAGISFLEAERVLDGCEQLVLLNDSTIFTPKSEGLFERFFEKLLPWQCLTFSSQPVFHAQSYFLSFSAEVFRSSIFRDFWKNYYPTSIRHRVIQSGELGLSRTLIASGFLPFSITLDLDFDEALNIHTEMNLAEKIALFSSDGGVPASSDVSAEMIANRVSHQLYERNPNQTLGLFLSRNFGFPLKRDTLYGRLYSLADIMSCLEAAGVPEEEREALQVLFLSTLVLRPGLLNALWRSLGLVR